MERRIKEIINQIIDELDFKKILFLDKILFFLLFKRENLLLKNKSKKEIDKISRILERYWRYQDLLRLELKDKKKYQPDLFFRFFPSPPRLVLLLTHRCQLRCSYCRVRKFPVSMSEETAYRAIDFLFTSNQTQLQLQFFGGEPLLEFTLLKKVVSYAQKKNKKVKRDLLFILTTNGIALTKEKMNFLKDYNFNIEFSIDGEVEKQLKSRKAANGKNYYQQVLDNSVYLKKNSLPYYSISVVTPENVASLYKSFQHLRSLEFNRVQINYALGVFWSQANKRLLFEQTQKMLKDIKNSNDLFLINTTRYRREPVVLNAELTVDCNGEIYFESGICLEEDFSAMKKNFYVADLNKVKDINYCGSTQFHNFYRLAQVYAKYNDSFRRIILNNIFIGLQYGELFKRWM